MKLNFFGLFDKKDGNLDSNTIKIKQNGFRILIVGVIILSIIGGTYMFDDNKKSQNIGSFDLYKDDPNVKTKWVSEAAQDLKVQNEIVKGLQQEVKRLSDENREMKKQYDDKLKDVKIINKVDAKKTEEKGYEDPNDVIGNLLKTDKKLYQKFPDTDAASFNPDMFLKENYNKDSTGTSNGEDINPNLPNGSPEINTVTEVQKVDNSLQVIAVQSEKKEQAEEKIPRSLLPTGSILHGTILNGMDAPTMSQAKDNPLITHIVLKNLAILPNNRDFDLRECFVLGEGYGDLASERVYIRTTDISCVNENDETINLELKGYAVGEDGKIGLRGEVVSKQGAVLARAIIAGFVDGVAKGFREVGNTIQVTPYGTTQSTGEMSSGSLMKKGAYNGISEGANRLMDFYLKLADQVFPIIEISAGRNIDIIVTSLKEIKAIDKYQKKDNTKPQK
ncbi:sex pilus assembly protein [Campylobacter hyointestinalis subsp. hyointestinalis]|uniref:Sex pilus assembly protein n=1 Tax=Campylobacter hyointestinalis subsp. hyointestinalis TaxID=91352 RepID=A0A0S4SWS4_CAMHY|nr:TrbI/VirB10 family protein [Campylobacter hyointestinalis]CUU89985.1 sex pilus assembly protein [Campylobacter hyointestinalis subsp. hyointestinalis]